MEDSTKQTDADGKPIEPSSQVVTDPSDADKPQYSENEVNKWMAAAQGSKDKELAELRPKTAQNEALLAEVKELKAKEATAQKAREEAELQAAEGDPDLVTVIKQRQAEARRLAQATEQANEAEARVKKADNISAAANAYATLEEAGKLADEFKIDVNKLLGFNAESPEEMRRIAVGLSKEPNAALETDPTKHKRPGTPAGGGDGGKVPTGSPKELALAAYQKQQKK